MPGITPNSLKMLYFEWHFPRNQMSDWNLEHKTSKSEGKPCQNWRWGGRFLPSYAFSLLFLSPLAFQSVRSPSDQAPPLENLRFLKSGFSKKKKSENELKVRTKERTRKTNNFIENEPRFSKQCRTVPQIILQRWGEFITWRKGRAVEWRVEWNGELASGWRNMHGADCTAVFPLAT